LSHHPRKFRFQSRIAERQLRARRPEIWSTQSPSGPAKSELNPCAYVRRWTAHLTPIRHTEMSMPPLPAYAELHCLSNFSFLRGASHAEELMAQARELGYTALAITDECSLAGVVRAHTASGRSAAASNYSSARSSRSTAGSAGGDRAQPRRVWPAVAADHARAPQGGEGQLRAVACRRGGIPVGRNRRHAGLWLPPVRTDPDEQGAWITA
jgi:hypothetical protein